MNKELPNFSNSSSNPVVKPQKPRKLTNKLLLALEAVNRAENAYAKAKQKYRRILAQPLELDFKVENH